MFGYLIVKDSRKKKSDDISHGKPSAGLNPLKAYQPSDIAKMGNNVGESKSVVTRRNVRNTYGAFPSFTLG